MRIIFIHYNGGGMLDTRLNMKVKILLILMLSHALPSGAAEEVTLYEVPYQSHKFCIYSFVSEADGELKTNTCAVANGESCTEFEKCKGDKTVVTKRAGVAGAEKEHKEWVRPADGAICVYPKNNYSMHIDDGSPKAPYICSTAIRCALKGKWIDWDRASCVGSDHPDYPGAVMCPGLTACKSKALSLPRPPADVPVLAGATSIVERAVAPSPATKGNRTTPSTPAVASAKSNSTNPASGVATRNHAVPSTPAVAPTRPTANGTSERGMKK